MSIYSKICIICNRDYKTMRISTLFCSKKCANRSRSLPTRIRESLINRNARFTLIEDNRTDHRILEDTALLTALAKEEARKRGITPPSDNVVEDNLKFINKTDPANGGSDGFGLLGEGTATNEDKSCTETNPKPVVQLTTEACLSFSQSTQSISKSPSKGLRRLGGK